MALGNQLTNKFQIGNAEVRIGTMLKANQLVQADSVGLLQSATVNFAQESVDLEGGLPKTLIDTAITKTTVTVTAQAYEYSRKNLRVMLNEGVEGTGVTEYAGTSVDVMAVSTAGTSMFDTTIPLADVTAGDLLVIYPAANPEKVSVVRVSAVAAATVATNAKVTIDNVKTPLLFDLAVGDVIFKANQIGLGNTSSTNYFSMDVIGLEHSTGRPVGFKFWKAAVSGGMEYSFSNDNFSVTPLSFKVLKPSVAEFSTGGPLLHLSDIIPAHPYGIQFSC